MATSSSPAGGALPAGSTLRAWCAGGVTGFAAALAVVSTAQPAHAAPAGAIEGPRAPHRPPRASSKGPGRRIGTLASPRPTMVGDTLVVRGRLPGLRHGSRVALQRLTPSGAWARVAVARISRRGAFTIRWRTRRPGRFTVRVAEPSPDATAAAAARPPTAPAAPAPAVVPTVQPTPGASPATTTAGRRRRARRPAVTRRREAVVYAPALASWFGPGFYGRRTFCGQVMTPGLLGLAHRTLPCGTRVEVSYRGRTAVAPVVDRGPFHATRTWDLTGALAQRLGFSGPDTIGTVALTRASRR